MGKHEKHWQLVRVLRILAMATICALSFLTSHALACGVALIIAVDVSGSVDQQEYRLQSKGLSDALGDNVVSEALVQANASVAYVQWSGHPHQSVSVPWISIDSHDDVARLRNQIELTPRAFRNYSTGIGDAIRVAADLFKSLPSPCKRKIIDVSGDGRSNEGLAPTAMRRRLHAENITVNGLAISGSEEGLAVYYDNQVIYGPAAFVEVAQGFKDFPRAIRKKLLRELADRVAMIPIYQQYPADTKQHFKRFLEEFE